MTGEPPLNCVEEHADFIHTKALDHLKSDRCLRCGRRFSYSVRSVGAGIRSSQDDSYCTTCWWERNYGY